MTIAFSSASTVYATSCAARMSKESYPVRTFETHAGACRGNASASGASMGRENRSNNSRPCTSSVYGGKCGQDNTMRKASLLIWYSMDTGSAPADAATSAAMQSPSMTIRVSPRLRSAVAMLIAFSQTGRRCAPVCVATIRFPLNRPSDPDDWGSL